MNYGENYGTLLDKGKDIRITTPSLTERYF